MAPATTTSSRAALPACSPSEATLTEEMPVSRATIDRALTVFDEWRMIVAPTDRIEPPLFARLVLWFTKSSRRMW